MSTSQRTCRYLALSFATLAVAVAVAAVAVAAVVVVVVAVVVLQASRLWRGQASTVRLFFARHGNLCQSLSCSGPKSGGKHALATEPTCRYAKSTGVIQHEHDETAS